MYHVTTNYPRLERSCLYKGYYTRGDVYAWDETDETWYLIAEGAQIKTSLSRPNTGHYDPYPSKEEQRRDRLAKPILVHRFEVEEWGFTNDWYIA